MHDVFASLRFNLGSGGGICVNLCDLWAVFGWAGALRPPRVAELDTEIAL
jgi:hypothetical protein